MQHGLRFLILTALSLCLLQATPHACVAAGTPDPKNFVLTDKEAVLLESPEVVADGPTLLTLWSPLGEHVLSLRARPDLRAGLAGRDAHAVSLVLWQAAGSRRREMWSGEGIPAKATWFRWFPGSETALALVDRPAGVPSGVAQPPGAGKTERWLLHIDARRTRSRFLFRVPDDTRVSVSPARPLAVLFSPSANGLRIVQADGAVRDYSSQLVQRSLEMAYWAEGGTVVAITSVATGGVPGTPRKEHRYLLDPAVGKLEETETRSDVALQADPPPGPLLLRSGTLTLEEGETTREVRPLWIEARAPSPRPRALVAADSPEGLLSPKGDAVLYTGEGAAYVRRLVRMDLGTYQQAVDRFEREKTLSNLRALADVILHYSYDTDETFPGADTDLPRVLKSYLRQRPLLEGFTYVFGGGKIADVAEPSKTVLGFTPVPGGKVSLFADGHVKYEPAGK